MSPQQFIDAVFRMRVNRRTLRLFCGFCGARLRTKIELVSECCSDCAREA